MENQSINKGMYKSQRIVSIDVLRGLVMILMVLDHTRDYFSNVAMNGLDINSFISLSAPLFATRLITNLCAPIFLLLVGIGMALAEKNGKSKSYIARFLFTRGIWMIISEIFLSNVVWTFSFGQSFHLFQIFYVTGIAMIALSALIWLPSWFILSIAVSTIFGHNLLDGHDKSIFGMFDFMHIVATKSLVVFGYQITVLLLYPIIPWIVVPALGYVIGGLYGIETKLRIKYLLIIGFASLGLFIILRLTNFYGEGVSKWHAVNSIPITILSLINCSKYPPSLQYLLFNLGVGFILLAFLEKLNPKNVFIKICQVFGSVPYFFYLLHVFLIHLLAVIVRYVNHGDVSGLFSVYLRSNHLDQYGYSLPIVYLVWVFVLCFAYPLCTRYKRFKQDHSQNIWLSYV